MRIIGYIATLIVLLGALNWGLIGLFDMNVIANIGGGDRAQTTRIIYDVIGICAFLSLLGFVRK